MPIISFDVLRARRDSCRGEALPIPCRVASPRDFIPADLAQLSETAESKQDNDKEGALCKLLGFRHLHPQWSTIRCPDLILIVELFQTDSSVCHSYHYQTVYSLFAIVNDGLK